MTDQKTQLKAGGGVRLPDRWTVGAIFIATLVLLPIAAIGWLALGPSQAIWSHLWATVMPRYVVNTLILVCGTGILAATVGTGAAWLVNTYRFPGRGWLQWALLLPLAVPGYVGAYAVVDLFEFAGPVQTALRNGIGLSLSGVDWLPGIRSRPMAVLVLAAALYPYVYLMSRAAFAEQSGLAYDVARTLGAGPWRRFFSVALPLARPAIAAGTAIVMMETAADFGVVEFFAVQTLTTGIFTTWLEGGSPSGAAQIALVVLVLMMALVGLEKSSRRHQRHYSLARTNRHAEPTKLVGIRGWAASALCVLPFAVGFLLPVLVLGWHALEQPGRWGDADLGRALFHTLATGAIAAVVTVSAALFMVYAVRQTGRALPRVLLPVTTVGYAAPGAVLGLGLLIPLAAFDNQLADTLVHFGLPDPGLILTGGAGAIIIAYCVRFFAIAQGAVDGALGRVPPNLGLAARTLGRSRGGALWSVELPLIRASVATALLLVFVDCVKELPATLLLRPFNYNTLATRVYEQASLERIGDAAPAALLVVAVGIAAVMTLARAMR